MSLIDRKHLVPVHHISADVPAQAPPTASTAQAFQVSRAQWIGLRSFLGIVTTILALAVIGCAVALYLSTRALTDLQNTPPPRAETILIVNLTVPEEEFVAVVSTQPGVLQFDKRPQLAGSVWAGPPVGSTSARAGAAPPHFRQLRPSDLPPISLADGGSVHGTLGPRNGGTGSNATLAGGRFMVSSSSGQSIVEAPPLLNGQIFIGGGGGGGGVPAVPTGTGGVTVTPGPGTLTIGLIPTPSFTTLNVIGTTTLGENTVCARPLSPSCINISNQTCPGGALSVQCVPRTGLHLTDLTVDRLTVLNFTESIMVATVNGSNIHADNIFVDNLHLTDNGTVTCEAGSAGIAPNCYDISGKSCPAGPLSQNCFPFNVTTANIQSTHTLTVNQVVCTGPSLPSNCVSIDAKKCTTPVNDTCISLHIKTINGVAPHPVTRDLVIPAPLLGSIGIVVPEGEFTVSNSPLTQSGNMTISTLAQSGNSFWLSPLDGSSGRPAFRRMGFRDLRNLNLTTGQVVAGCSGGDPVPTDFVAGDNIIITRTPGSIVISATCPPPPPLSTTIATYPSTTTTAAPTTTTTTATAAPATTCPSGGGGSGSNGTVTSIGFVTVPDSIFSVSPAVPITTNGTFTLAMLPQQPNVFFAGPSSGSSPAIPTMRRITLPDLPPLGPGQIYIGDPISCTTSISTLAPGPGVSIVTSGGTTTISFVAPPTTTCASTTATDTLAPTTATTTTTTTYAPTTTDPPLPSSVGLSLPASVFTVTHSPVIGGTGTLVAVFENQSAGTFFAGPSTGTPATPSFRPMVADDVPSLPVSRLTSGVLPIARGGTASGTALNNNRIMISSNGCILEAGAMANGTLLIGTGPNSPPIVAALTAGDNVDIVNSAGRIVISSRCPTPPPPPPPACSGVLAGAGEIAVFSTSPILTAISAVSNGVSNMVEIVSSGATLSLGAISFDSPACGKLRYRGTVPVLCRVSATFSGSASGSGSNDQFVVAIAVNGIVQPRTRVIQKMQASQDYQSATVQGQFMMQPNDQLSLFAGNLISTSDLRLFSENLSAMCFTVAAA